jgi:transcriptional regulator with XRE-family HTH domain
MRIMEAVPALKTFRETQQPPLSQREAAALVGVARETWARWESGKRRVDDDKLPLLAEKTGLSRDVLRPDLSRLLQTGALPEPAGASR